MKIFLIRSGPFTNKQVEQVHHKVGNINDTDIVVRFNKPINGNMKLFKGKTDYRFIRGYGVHVDIKNKTLWGGIDPNVKYVVYNTKYINDMNDLHIHQIIERADLIELALRYNLKKSDGSIAGPTLGFYAIDWFRRKYPKSPIFLIDFSFPKAPPHDATKEKIITEAMENLNIISI